MLVKTSNQPELELGFGGYRCNWGTHICGLYETDAERDAILFGFLGQGARERDLQLYCPTEHTADSFVESFDHACPDCADSVHDPAMFQFLTARELYYPDGTFSPSRMDAGLSGFYRHSQKDGPRNVRATAEMVWALEAIPGIEHLMVYESRLNYFIPGKPWISICLYNLRRFDGKTIMDVLRTHPYSISGGVVTQNPFYQDPDDWLARNAPEFANH